MASEPVESAKPCTSKVACGYGAIFSTNQSSWRIASGPSVAWPVWKYTIAAKRPASACAACCCAFAAACSASRRLVSAS